MNKRVLLVSVIVFLVLLITNMKQVKAEVSGILVSGEITDECLEKIPEIYGLEIDEIEFKRAEEILFRKIAEELKKQNIVIREANLSDFQQIYTFIDICVFDDIKKASISINRQEGNLAEKNVSLIYKNSKEYNEKDKQYVEEFLNNIDFPRNAENECLLKNYIELGREMPEFSSYITNAVENKINAEEITIVYQKGYGDTNIFNTESRSIFNVFKNGVFYSNLYITYQCIYEIKIPSEVEDTEEACIGYALPMIKEYINKYYRVNGIGEVEVKNIELRKLHDNEYRIIDNQGDGFQGREEKVSLVKEVSKVQEEENNETTAKLEFANWFLVSAILIIVIIMIIFKF